MLLIHSDTWIGNLAAASKIYTISVSKEAGTPRGTMHLLGLISGASGASGGPLDIGLHDHMDTMTKFHATVQGDTITITGRHPVH